MKSYKAKDFECANCNSNDGQVLEHDIYRHILCNDCSWERYFRPENCCTKPEFVMIQLEIRNGHKVQRKACVNCKEVNAMNFKQQENFNLLPFLTYENHKIYKDKKNYERDLFYDEVKTHKENIRILDKQAWDQQHKEVLQSNEWKIKRQKVIKRCNNICEGCGSNPVEEVHHLTYDRLGEEFLFQLLGLCKNCHSEIHSS